MRRTAEPPLYALIDALDFEPIINMLDVGGGDGTIACGLANHASNIKVTVYNLPASIKIAKENIKQCNLSSRVSVFEGDFLKNDSLPSGFDTILFSRVLWDWSPETCYRLIKMAYDALPQYGMIVICETFLETSEEFSLAFEFRYLFWDDFEVACFKTSNEYQKILTEVGFKFIELKEVENNAYSLLTAQKL
jgi:16S rRNA G1207 methylase RsmC